MNQFLLSILNYFKSEEGKKALLNFYYDKLVQSAKDKFKALLLKILKHELMGGFKAKLIFFIVDHFVDDLIIPLAQYMKRSGKQYYYTAEGKSLVLKLSEARANGNQTDYDNTVDDILN
jgi:hypothetical protein